MKYINEKREQEEIANIEISTINKVCDLLSQYENDINEYLFMFVARLCDVKEMDMFVDNSTLKNVHARWFYWYAYRYMTGEEYKTIATKHADIRRFATSCITNSIKKMSSMITHYQIWGKRWDIMKRIIDVILEKRNETCEHEKTITLKVRTPRGINIEVKQDK